MEIFIGLLIGSVLGLTGAGGSIFAVPLLILLLGMETVEAMGLALGAVAASASVGAYRHRRQVDWQIAFLLIGGGIITAPLGKWASLHINDSALTYGFSAIAMIIAIRMMRQASVSPSDASHTRASIFSDLSEPSTMLPSQARYGFYLPYIIGGIVIGFASGVFGVGGGFLIVPLLIFLGSFTMSQAIATSLASIAFISGSGFISYYFISDSVNTVTLFKVLVAAVAGMILSQHLVQFISPARLQKVFSVLLFIISITLIIKIETP